MNDLRNYYVIKHKTDGYLPSLDGSGLRAGYTATEPTNLGVPRLFLDESAAKRALTWWLKGITSVSRTRDWDGEDYSENWDVEFDPTRKKEDMEVVKVMLKL